MVGWHHQLNGHEFEQARGDDEGQGGLACYSPWGHKELDTTEQVNNNRGSGGVRVGMKVCLSLMPLCFLNYKTNKNQNTIWNCFSSFLLRFQDSF